MKFGGQSMQDFNSSTLQLFNYYYYYDYQTV